MINDPQPQSTLWRYIDISKFSSMIDRKEVYFSNPSEFNDKREGNLVNTHKFITERLDSVLPSHYEDFFKNMDKIPSQDERAKYRFIAELSCDYASRIGSDFDEERKEYFAQLERLVIYNDTSIIPILGKLLHKLLRLELTRMRAMLFVKPIFIYCWHQNEDESEAMWRIYGNKGLALKSSPEKLLSSISIPEDNKFVKHISTLKEVHYVEKPDKIMGELREIYKSKELKDIKNPYFKHLNGEPMYKPYFIKHIAYKYETEVRYIIQEVREVKPARNPPQTFKGKYVKANLEGLISEIVISPYAEDWFFEVIQNMVWKQGLNIVVKKSPLNANNT